MKNGANVKKLWSKNYIFLMISNFFLFFGDNLLLPVIPVYIKQVGASDFQIGIVASVFFATSILMRIFTSRVSALIGRKTLLIIAMSVCCLAMMGYYLSAGLMIVLLFRLVQGAGFGASTTLYSALVADIIPYERMGEGMGYFGLGVTLAAALGPFLGASAVSLPEFKWVFIVATVLVLISVLLSALSKADNSKTEVIKKPSMKEFLSDFVEPRAFYPAVFMLLLGLAMGGFFTYIVLFGEERNIHGISLFFIITSVAEFIARLISGKIYDKRGMNCVVIPGAVFGILACVVIASAYSLITVAIAAIFTGLSFGMIFPILEAIAMKSAGAERRVAASATLYNFLDIGTGLGPLLFGAVAQLRSYADAFLLSAVIFAVMLVVVLVARILRLTTNDGLLSKNDG